MYGIVPNICPINHKKRGKYTSTMVLNFLLRVTIVMAMPNQPLLETWPPARSRGRSPVADRQFVNRSMASNLSRMLHVWNLPHK